MNRNEPRIRRPARAAVWAAAICAAVWQAGPAQADEAYAREVFQQMSDYMGAQNALAFDYDASLDVITGDNRKFAIASSGSVALERPAMLHATRDGGFASIALAYDGQIMTVVNADAKTYATIETAGSLDALIDTLRDSYGQPLPAADLLGSDVAGALLPLITEFRDLGAGVVGGMTCDHFAMRTEQADIQIWIARGDAPHPCRYVITDTGVTGWPEYRIDLRNWRTGEGVADHLTLVLPEGASQVDLKAVPDINELSGIYAQ